MYFILYVYLIFSIASVPTATTHTFNLTNDDIEITSDSLSIDVDNKQGRFVGKVKVVQGTTRLFSNKMTVHYENNKSFSGSGKISHIDFVGNILLTTPDEKITGESGSYNFKSSTLTLIGNVVLSNKQSVMKGDRFTYNSADGKASLSSSSNKRTTALLLPSK